MQEDTARSARNAKPAPKTPEERTQEAANKARDQARRDHIQLLNAADSPGFDLLDVAEEWAPDAYAAALKESSTKDARSRAADIPELATRIRQAVRYFNAIAKALAGPS